MELHDLSPAEGSKTDSVRKGRGVGSPHGERGGRGTKGQKKRNNIPIYFEGGQTPLYRRIPKLGFNSRDPVIYQEVNVLSLNSFDSNQTLTPEDLLDAGLVDQLEPVKLLGKGDLDVSSLTIEVHAVSDGAREKVQQQDGTVDILPSSESSKDN